MALKPKTTHPFSDDEWCIILPFVPFLTQECPEQACIVVSCYVVLVILLCFRLKCCDHDPRYLLSLLFDYKYKKVMTSIIQDCLKYKRNVTTYPQEWWYRKQANCNIDAFMLWMNAFSLMLVFPFNSIEVKNKNWKNWFFDIIQIQG